MKPLLLIGCTVILSCAGAPGPGGDAGLIIDATYDGGDEATLADGGRALTWFKDVLPVAQANCLVCHQGGTVAPFSMNDVTVLKQWAPAMATSTAAKLMPPWPPDESCRDLKGTRSLPQAQIDLFANWVAQGSHLGDPHEAPPIPDGGTGLPSPDLTLTPTGPYTPKENLTDDYHCFAMPTALAQDMFVTGIEVNAGTPKEVHHVIVYEVTPTSAVNNDNKEAGIGWTCFGGPGDANAVMLGGWVPGTTYTVYPAGTGIRLIKGRTVVMQIHYNTQYAARAPDTTTVKLKLAASVPNEATILPVVQNTFAIPPNAMGYSVTQSVNTPAFSVKLHSILPHMHTKGAAIKATLGNQCLIDIPTWDFHWQQLFFFEQPVTVTPGQQFKLTCTWNNPTANTVTWGEGTDDEMCLTYLYLTL